MNSQKRKYIAFLLAIILFFTLNGCGVNNIFTKDKKLSEVMLGQWNGELDVAKFCYKELGEELGIDITPEPKCCEIYLYFYEDGRFLFKIDIDSFGRALGECAEPYTSALFGFDTGFIVDLIMQYVANEIPIDSGEAWGTYLIDDNNKTITMMTEDGKQETIELTKEGYLEFYEDFWGQVFSLKHE